jgi:membrane protease YdiL (CAAX protease family)
MPPATENQQAPNSSSLIRGVVARHPVAAFLVMAFVIGWGGMLPLLLSQSGPFGVLPIELPWKPFTAILSIFGLALPAFLVTAATGGKDGVRDLLRRIFRWRVGVHWYLLALFGLLVATLLGAIPFLGVVPLETLAQNWTLLFTVFLPGVLVPFVLINPWEETGWTGFMQHTLQEGHGPLLAGVIVAPFFALIHLPAYFVAGWISDEKMSLSEFPAVLVQVGVIAVFAIFLRVLIMWLYNGSGRSVLIVGLFHSAFNMTNGQKITPELFHLPESLAALIPLAPVALIAVLLVVFTRGRLAYEPGHGALPRAVEAGERQPNRGCDDPIPGSPCLSLSTRRFWD